MVHEGLGVALVPRLARLPAGYDIVRVPLAGDPSPSRHIRTGIRAGSSQSPLVATALSCLPLMAARTRGLARRFQPGHAEMWPVR
ncbi:hypothetical protein L0A91_01315 [Ornithinimicrobium sp. INDO-MA30-4]|nr:hypothetical protein [Ornithinimicrobium sp. INDO-MA30-4]UJH70732.1 hypothetical protein L0A91_01315 [Ornithinimicrobium sp. INDO-MA30-4]